jgi:hypothetical protein
LPRTDATLSESRNTLARRSENGQLEVELARPLRTDGSDSSDRSKPASRSVWTPPRDRRRSTFDFTVVRASDAAAGPKWWIAERRIHNNPRGRPAQGRQVRPEGRNRGTTSSPGIAWRRSTRSSTASATTRSSGPRPFPRLGHGGKAARPCAERGQLWIQHVSDTGVAAPSSAPSSATCGAFRIAFDQKPNASSRSITCGRSSCTMCSS